MVYSKEKYYNMLTDENRTEKVRWDFEKGEYRYEQKPRGWWKIGDKEHKKIVRF